MTRVRAFSVGVLAAITIAVIIHGDLLWLAYMLASNLACLAIGLLANLADHHPGDGWRDLERRPPRSIP